MRDVRSFGRKQELEVLEVFLGDRKAVGLVPEDRMEVGYLLRLRLTSESLDDNMGQIVEEEGYLSSVVPAINLVSFVTHDKDTKRCRINLLGRPTEDALHHPDIFPCLGYDPIFARCSLTFFRSFSRALSIAIAISGSKPGNFSSTFCLSSLYCLSKTDKAVF